MPNTSFSAEIAEWARNVEGAVEAIIKESAQDVVEEMQKVGYSVAAQKKAITKGLGSVGRGKNRKAIQGPVAATGGGGNLPVDTGFLRASLMASASAMPQIERGKRPVDGKAYAFDFGEIEAVIAGADTSKPLFFGYTAAYANAVHWGLNGQTPRRWVSLAAQKWSQYVDARAAEAKSRLGL